MAKKFSQLRAGLSPAAQERANASAKKMLAEILYVQRPSIAKLEKERTCIYPHCAAILRQWAANSTSLRVSPMES